MPLPAFDRSSHIPARSLPIRATPLICLLILAASFGAACESGDRASRRRGENTAIGSPDTLPAPLRPADSRTPSAPVCAFQAGHRVSFEIIDGIPNPRCARATADQGLELVNRTGERIAFDLGGGPIAIDPGMTWRRDHPVSAWLSPGVHRIGMAFYAGSGPEVWVPDSSVVRIEGPVSETFVSARAIVVAASAGSRNVAIDAETRLFSSDGAPASPDRFSLLFSAGTEVRAIVDMESVDTGTALEIRVLPRDD